MSITEELREYVKEQISWLDASKVHYRKLLAIADRIDAEHEAKVAYWQEASYKDGYDEGFVSADDWLAQHEDAMAEHGWARLPRDADGEVIHVGDVMDSKVDYLFDGKPFEVRALVLCEDGWEVADGRFGNRYEPDSLRHHHAPTVEDVLLEFARECLTYATCVEDHEVTDAIELYAPKLRLVGDAE